MADQVMQQQPDSYYQQVWAGLGPIIQAYYGDYATWLHQGARTNIPGQPAAPKPQPVSNPAMAQARGTSAPGIYDVSSVRIPTPPPTPIQGGPAQPIGGVMQPPPDPTTGYLGGPGIGPPTPTNPGKLAMSGVMRTPAAAGASSPTMPATQPGTLSGIMR